MDLREKIAATVLLKLQQQAIYIGPPDWDDDGNEIASDTVRMEGDFNVWSITDAVIAALPPCPICADRRRKQRERVRKWRERHG